MTRDEACKLKSGDEVSVGSLRVQVKNVVTEHGDTFICTDYGNFSISVCEAVKTND